MQIGFGRTAKEAEDALKGEATPIITLAIDREQEEESAGDFVAAARRLQELEEAAQAKGKST